MSNKVHVKTGDEVIVIQGKDRGVKGKVLQVSPSEGKVIVEGVNVCKKHLKPKNNNGTGEIVEVEAPIHASNVMLIDPKTKKPTKVRVEKDSKGKKIRISKKSNEKID